MATILPPNPPITILDQRLIASDSKKFGLATAADRVVRSGALLLLIAAVVALRDQERALVLARSPGKLPPEPGPP